MATYQATRLLHQAHAAEQLLHHFDQLTWSPERLREHRERRLRRLLVLARERSPWHRQRLSGLDLDRLELDRLDEAQLEAIPPMTKHDLMANFDQIVTDPRLTLRSVEDHLAGLQSDAYLLERYHAIASGGSSGRRGVYVYDWEGWSDWFLTVVRRLLRALRTTAADAERPIVAAVVMGERASHGSSAAPQTFRELGNVLWNRVPISAPPAEQLSRLQELQPELLACYPSRLRQLALAQQSGALSIAPRVVFSTAEPLLPATRAEVEQTWGCSIVNCWASSEAGAMAVSCGHGAELHLSDDRLIIEPVDREGRPVPVGVRSSKIYMTNLFNELLPLIRFEITDELTLSDRVCPCGSPHRLVAAVEGRLDECFEYPGLEPIHPQRFRSRLGRERNLVEYQVRQLPRGVEVSLQSQGELDLQQLRADLVQALSQAGLSDPKVVLHTDRPFTTTAVGKLPRFIPLAVSSGASSGVSSGAPAGGRPLEAQPSRELDARAGS